MPNEGYIIICFCMTLIEEAQLTKTKTGAAIPSNLPSLLNPVQVAYAPFNWKRVHDIYIFGQ